MFERLTECYLIFLQALLVEYLSTVIVFLAQESHWRELPNAVSPAPFAKEPF